MIKTKTVKILSYDKFYFLVILIVPMLILFCGKMFPSYSTNDDFVMGQLVSGAYTGIPETHLVHMGYLTGLLISCLYRIIPSVPWYGIYIVGCAYISVVLVFFLMMKYVKIIWQKVLLCLVSLGLIYGFLLAHIIQFQFTTVTAIVCGASIVFFYRVDVQENVKEYLICQIPSFILFCISFELRDDACIMFLPLIGFLGLSRLLQNRKMFRQLVGYAAVLIGLIAIMFILEQVVYSGAEWKEYLRFSVNRAKIVDYEGFPDYEENREIYEELGVSEVSYQAITNIYLYILDENVNADFMETIADLNIKRSKSLQEIAREFYLMHKEVRYDYPINQMVYLMYAMVVLMIFLTKKYKGMIDVLALLSGRMIIWLYLIYIGRPIFRVTQGIYIVEMFVLVAIFVTHELWHHKNNNGNIVLRGILAFEIVGTLLVSYRWGENNLSNMILQNSNLEQRFAAYEELMQYLSQNEKNLYLLDVSGFKLYFGGAFKTNMKQNGNCIWMGGWTSNSPYTDRVAKKYGIEDYEKATLEQDNVYFVFLNSEDESYTYLAKYYEEKHPGTELKIVDRVQTSLEEEFFILQCTK